jgi:hypothetical protein
VSDGRREGEVPVPVPVVPVVLPVVLVLPVRLGVVVVVGEVVEEVRTFLVLVDILGTTTTESAEFGNVVGKVNVAKTGAGVVEAGEADHTTSRGSCWSPPVVVARVARDVLSLARTS